MGALSKEANAISKKMFYERLPPGVMCNWMHPWSGDCMRANRYLIQQAIIGGCKFFLPIYILQAIINRKKIDKNYMKKWCRDFVRTIIYSVLFQSAFLSSICLFCKLFGRLHYYNICLFPGFMAGLPIYIESRENRNLNTLYFFTVFVEAMIRNAEALKLINRTRIKDTACFMVSCSALMYLYKTQCYKPYTSLWFYRPPVIKPSENADMSKCQHQEECIKYMLDGFSSYFGIGYALEMVKFLLNNLGLLVKQPKLVTKMLLNKNSFLLGLVTGGYVALYRYITCYLLKRDKGEYEYHSAIAGLLAGSTYFIKPNIQLGITSFSTIMQLLLQRLQRKVPISGNYTGILFALLNGILIHNRFLYPSTSPNYTKHMITMCSNGLGDQVLQLVTQMVFHKD